ncbi:hypothetical protein BSKO_06371 [Bryopsis sp. KO-2023]|nr:hypothetical protein BSKO_06371 [Bryopsis sp. KO-2023]
MSRISSRLDDLDAPVIKMRLRRAAATNRRLHQTPSGESQGLRNVLDGVYAAWRKRAWRSQNSKKRCRDPSSLEAALGLPDNWPPLRKKSRAKRAKLEKPWTAPDSQHPAHVLLQQNEVDGRKSCGSAIGDECLNASSVQGQSSIHKELAGGLTRPWEHPSKNPTSEGEKEEEEVDGGASPRCSKYTKAVPKQSALKRSKNLTQKRVQFKEGCLGRKYGTDDGHPVENGGKPQIQPIFRIQNRSSVGSPSTKSLTVKKIKEVEVLLDGTCEASLKRLRRRAGLEPLRIPDLKFVTSPKKERVQRDRS